MHPIQLAITYADEVGLDCYPVGSIQDQKIILENAIALIGFNDIVEVFKTARLTSGSICLFKSTDSELLYIAGDLDIVLNFLSEKSANKLDLICNGEVWIVGVKVTSYHDLKEESPRLN